MSASHRQVFPSSTDSQTPTLLAGDHSCFPTYSSRPSASTVGPCGLFTGTRYGVDQVIPPSVERSIQVSSRPRRCSGVVRRSTACQRATLSGSQPDASFETASYASEVKVVTSNDPVGVCRTPASRSSIGESQITSGQLQCRPPSRDRISSTRPNGQTWASRPPE